MLKVQHKNKHNQCNPNKRNNNLYRTIKSLHKHLNSNLKNILNLNNLCRYLITSNLKLILNNPNRILLSINRLKFKILMDNHNCKITPVLLFMLNQILIIKFLLHSLKNKTRTLLLNNPNQTQATLQFNKLQKILLLQTHKMYY